MSNFPAVATSVKGAFSLICPLGPTYIPLFSRISNRTDVFPAMTLTCFPRTFQLNLFQGPVFLADVRFIHADSSYVQDLELYKHNESQTDRDSAENPTFNLDRVLSYFKSFVEKRKCSVKHRNQEIIKETSSPFVIPFRLVAVTG